jgi:iron complex outermembrane recepter protein
MGLTHFIRRIVKGLLSVLSAHSRLLPTGAGLVAGVLCCAVAGAEASREPTATRQTYNVPRGDATRTLGQYAGVASRQIVYLMDKVRGVQTNAIEGEYSPDEALARMLAGTELVARHDAATGAVMISRTPARAEPPPPRAPTSESNSMNSNVRSKRPKLIALMAGWLALAVGPAQINAEDGSPATSGTIEGRVANAVTGEFLNNARVSIADTTLETQTNSFGEYRFTRVPAGSVLVRVNVAGHKPTNATATVVAGTVATLDLHVGLDAKQEKEGDAVVLDRFVVAAQREMSGNAIAINERRAAANLRNVVAADEFGDSTEGNVGEFIKYIPAVAIDYTSAEPRFISVRGLPSFGTAVMIDGNRMASAAASFSRAVELDQVSLNNMSRIEVAKSPTPDSPADTIGGSVNMVLKSAFERTKPVFNYRVNLNANYNDTHGARPSFHKTAGPGYERTAKVKPGFDLNYIHPVSRDFGYTVSLMTANQFTPESFASFDWKPTGLASSLAPADRPFLSAFGVRDGPKEIYRWSVGATVDWRIRPQDVVSIAGQWNSFDTTVVNNLHRFDSAGSRGVAPAAYGPTFMESAPGSSTAAHQTAYQHKIGTGYNLRLTHRHTGLVWRTESGMAYSTSVSDFTGLEDGTIRTAQARIRNATLRLDGIKDSLPSSVSMWTTANVPIDYRELDNYTLDSVTSSPSWQVSTTTSAFANATRQFHGPLGLRVKSGFDVRREDRDFRNPTSTWTFVGPDGVAGTADDSLSRYDLAFSDYAGVEQPFGFGPLERPSNQKAYTLLQEHPEYFSLNEASLISSNATQSRNLTESVAAGYIRADASFLKNRLKMTGGVRYERTFDEGYGVLNDIRATYQRTASGEIMRDAAGRPVRIAGDATKLAGLQYKERGAHAQRDYGNFYPSFNTTFSITERLLLRASYAETITRPQLSNILPSVTASDPTVTTGIPTLTVSNTALKPWSARSYDLALEYYFEQPGLVSFGVFQKDISDFFGSVRTRATPELLAEYGLDDSYLVYDVVTRRNVGAARVSGMEAEYRQTLSFLPSWARGISVFANSTALHLEGEAIADFSGFIARTTNWGISLNRSRYTVRLNWNLRGRQRMGSVTGNNIPAGTFEYRNPRRTLDLNAEWRINRYIGLFTNLRNVTNVAWWSEIYGPETPAYARANNLTQFGVQGIVGVKGSF